LTRASNPSNYTFAQGSLISSPKLALFRAPVPLFALQDSECTWRPQPSFLLGGSATQIFQLPQVGSSVSELPAIAPPGGVGRDFILPGLEDNLLEIGEGEGTSDPAPLQCNQQWYRIIKGQRNAIKVIENASMADCGPRKKHWRWYRDRRIAMRKKKGVI
ncbi:unnamed protein product, partial [Polarella glacialis]